jgi:glycosyltransferase involved in cell wall biosynthesis
MATIVFVLDIATRFDGTHLETRPLGGTESSLIRVARELARRQHDVAVYTNCECPVVHEGVRWLPLTEPRPDSCDLFVVVQHPRLLGFVRSPKRRAIWVIWQSNHLKHYKQIWRMWLYRPVPILMSLHQVHRYSPLLPRRDPHILIPLGLPDDVRGKPPLGEPPPPRAVFASRPNLRLRELVDIWGASILPRVPGAVLDVYGVNQLEPGQDAWKLWAGTYLPADAAPEIKRSVRVHAATSREALIEAMRSSRALLYLGHHLEAFCLVVAEAQALGLPAVVGPLGAVGERVIDGVTGFHRSDPPGFGDAAVSLLTDDTLWRRQHQAALRHQQGISWSEYAGRFEAALLGDRHPLFRSVLDVPAAD